MAALEAAIQNVHAEARRLRSNSSTPRSPRALLLLLDGRLKGGHDEQMNGIELRT
jgi:hypothetical protein